MQDDVQHTPQTYGIDPPILQFVSGSAAAIASLAKASLLSSGAQPHRLVGGVLWWDMFGCGPLLRHDLLLLLLPLCSGESSRAGRCGALPKKQKASLFFHVLGGWGPVLGI